MAVWEAIAGECGGRNRCSKMKGCWSQNQHPELVFLSEAFTRPRIMHKLAKVGLDNLERSNPNFDNSKFKMKDKFLELKKLINQVMGSGK